VAIKKLHMHQYNNPELVNEFRSEVRMLRKLRHPNIILFMAACTKPPNLCVVTELLAGSLFDLLHNSDINLTWKQRLQIALDTAKGMSFLHLNNPPIIHRDLKSPNVLLDATRRSKVCDFGLARTKAINTMTGQCGTFQWMAPEVIANGKYTEKADVFSFGVIMWELVSRELPYNGMNSVQVSVAVLTKAYRPPIPRNTPAEYAKLIEEAWHQEPSKRPSFEYIVEKLTAMINSEAASLQLAAHQQQLAQAAHSANAGMPVVNAAQLSSALAANNNNNNGNANAKAQGDARASPVGNAVPVEYQTAQKRPS
jgi:serine/threonine protein kinase